ncbi:MAG: nicotinamide-nucleotide amidohydrolase family protein, partial [Deltaproteobacteria bacterium]
VPLVRDAAALARIEALLARRNRRINDSQMRQADRPQTARLVDNAVGTAPGFALQHAGCEFIALPGIPAEFDAMVQAEILAPRRGEAPVLRRALYCFGVMEADLDQRLGGLHQSFPQVRLQFQVKFPEVHIGMHAPPAAAASLDAAFAQAQATLGPDAFADHRAPASLPQAVLSACVAQGATLSVAESCTGGLVCDLLTDLPGSSAAFLGGIVAYDNALKTQLLGVEEASLRSHGAVSEPVVRQMAAQVRARLHSTYGLSISGVAGPGGGSDHKPVGTTWVALAGPQHTEVRQLKLPFARRGNKQVAAYTALDLLRRALLRTGGP